MTKDLYKVLDVDKSVIECQGEQHFKPVDFGNKGVKITNKIFYFTDKIECINGGGYLDIVYTDTNDLINNIING